MPRRIGQCRCFVSLIAGVLGAAILVPWVPGHAKAESGDLNAHLDVTFGAPVTGELSAPGRDGADRLIPAGWVSLDWQFAAPVAADVLIGFGRQLERSNSLGARDAGFWAAALGLRFRLFDDTSGYETEPLGKLHGNLWGSVHIGYFGLDEAEFGAAVSVGYEMSVVRPLSVGVLFRAAVVDGGGFDGVHLLMWGGLGVSISLTGEPDAQIADADGDGILDEDERSGGTDPRAADSDQDGLSDALEAEWGTDPLNRDTDGDGLTDGEEDRNRNGRRDLDETDPTLADTDGGGASDGRERIALADPLDPRDDGRLSSAGDGDGDGVDDPSDRCPTTPPGVPVDEGGCPALAETITLEGVQFASGSAEFLSSATPNLAKALLLLTQHPDVEVEIAGHTDNRGAEWFNRRLSRYRAEAVRIWLVQRGVSESRLTAQGYGSAEPIADNGTAEGRAENRRIEFRRVSTAE